MLAKVCFGGLSHWIYKYDLDDVKINGHEKVLTSSVRKVTRGHVFS